MRTPRRKRQPDSFDVAEFLRESDDDLKSALNSLLRTPSGDPAPGVKLIPGANLEADHKIAPESKIGAELETPPQLEVSTPDLISDPESTIGPGTDISGPLNLTPGPETLPPGPSVVSSNPIPAPTFVPVRKLAPEDKLGADVSLRADVNLAPGVNLSDIPKRREFPVREMKTPEEAHTRAEQQLYEYLWENAAPLDDVSRAITTGFGALSKVVRLSESNTRINVRSLIGKLAVEECGSYDCEKSLGRTYRVFSLPEIARRRREAGLVWYMRRTLAVVFVDPVTKQPLDLGVRRPGHRRA